MNPLIDAKILYYTSYQEGMEGYYVNKVKVGDEFTHKIVFLSQGRMHLISCMQALSPKGEFAGPVILITGWENENIHC